MDNIPVAEVVISQTRTCTNCLSSDQAIDARFCDACGCKFASHDNIVLMNEIRELQSSGLLTQELAEDLVLDLINYGDHSGKVAIFIKKVKKQRKKEETIETVTKHFENENETQVKFDDPFSYLKNAQVELAVEDCLAHDGETNDSIEQEITEQESIIPKKKSNFLSELIKAVEETRNYPYSTSMKNFFYINFYSEELASEMTNPQSLAIMVLIIWIIYGAILIALRIIVLAMLVFGLSSMFAIFITPIWWWVIVGSPELFFPTNSNTEVEVFMNLSNLTKHMCFAGSGFFVVSFLLVFILKFFPEKNRKVFPKLFNLSVMLLYIGFVLIIICGGLVPCLVAQNTYLRFNFLNNWILVVDCNLAGVSLFGIVPNILAVILGLFIFFYVSAKVIILLLPF